MPTSEIERSKEIYRIKVTLLGTSPAIWRRLLVPADMTLAQLHDVSQTVMGWKKAHLHEFVIGQKRFGTDDADDGSMNEPTCVDERGVRLVDLLGKIGAEAIYIYDFCDNWEHRVRVEKIQPPESEGEYPLCIAGELACPPEDCGGVGGYYELLEALADFEHEEHEETLSWVGEGFDPDFFSPAFVNAQLEELRSARMPLA